MKPRRKSRVRCSAWLGRWVIRFTAKQFFRTHLKVFHVRFAQASMRTILSLCGGAVPSRYELRLQCCNLAMKFKILFLQCQLAERRCSLFLLGHVLRPFGWRIVEWPNVAGEPAPAWDKRESKTL